MNRKSVGILIFDDVEVLDFCGPYEVFSVTRLDEAKRREEPSPFEVRLVAEQLKPVTAAGGMRVLPDVTTADGPRLDVLVVPGGWGTRRERLNEPLLDWIRTRAGEVELLTSVCTGALLLGEAGLLDGRAATTHWRSIDWMRELCRSVDVREGVRYVEDGSVITSAGIAAGIEMALRVVERFHGSGVARATAAQMEYPYWQTDPPTG
jgi:transcriptional regulator GlxA family with amidase domain